jgi:hypothetical protein
LNASTAQFVTWNGTERYELALSTPVPAPVTAIGLQFVGLKVKWSRLSVALTVRSLIGIPSMIVGNGSVVTVTSRISRVDIDLAPLGTNVPEVERPGYHRNHDRQTERSTLVGPVR